MRRGRGSSLTVKPKKGRAVKLVAPKVKYIRSSVKGRRR